MLIRSVGGEEAGLIKAVLFDYGGTLVKERRPWDEAVSEATAASYALLRRRGLKATWDEYAVLNDSIFHKHSELEKQTGLDVPDIVKYREMVDALFPTSSKAWREKTALQANSAFWSVATANFTLQKGAKRCLAELKSMNLRLAVVSNHHNHAALADHLIQLELKSYFSRIVVSSRVGFRKPDQRIFATCLSSLRVTPQQAVFVGDSISNDIEGAKRAGMTTILIGGVGRHHGRGKPDFAVASLPEIPGIISSL
jgi:HAD superfamily hydrolase (TIGR01509 family)